jgi:hypothetical protein
VRDVRRAKSGLGLEHLDYLSKLETERLLLRLSKIISDLRSIREDRRADALELLARSWARDWGLK